MSLFKKVPPALSELMKKAGSNNPDIATKAQIEFAQAISIPVQEALLNADILGNLFQPVDLTDGESLDYPLDILNPGQEKDFIAYNNPGNGRIPERQVDADYVHLRTYMIANSIDVILRILRDANWDILGRMVEVLEAGFRAKMNRDGWRVILASAASRGVQIYDGTSGTNGFFTRRLLSNLGIEMRRQGGNFTALRRRKVTHVFTSPEAMEDIRNWSATEVDDITRRELYQTTLGDISQVGDVKIVVLDEFGVDQEFNDYYTDTLGVTIDNSKTEICVAADLNSSSLVMPVREKLMITSDPTMHRSQKAGFYGWFEGGFSALDNRDLLIGAI